MPTSTAPQTDLPPWATGNYGAGAFSWSATARRVATNLTALAAAGLTPNLRTTAQFFNEWLARDQEWSTFFRGELGTAIYGDGSDGDVTLGAGTTTLTRDMYYDDLTVPNGATLATSGFRVFVAGLLTVGATGVIHNDGGNAAAGVAGTAGAGGLLGGGSAGATGVQNTMGQVGDAGAALSSQLAIGGAGGTGGAAGANAGGAGGTALAAAAEGGSRHQAAALGLSFLGNEWVGGSGGGSGGTLNGNGTSGAGGGGAGLVSLWARRVSNAGTIRANGGNGGAATVGTSTSIGGGAGGGGGRVWLVHREAVGGTLGTVTASGGSGGAPGGTGSAGASGSAGSVVLLVA